MREDLRRFGERFAAMQTSYRLVQLKASYFWRNARAEGLMMRTSSQAIVKWRITPNACDINASSAEENDYSILTVSAFVFRSCTMKQVPMAQTCSHARLIKYSMITTLPSRCFCTLPNKLFTLVTRITLFRCQRNTLIGWDTSETRKEGRLQVIRWWQSALRWCVKKQNLSQANVQSERGKTVTKLGKIDCKN